MSNNRIIQNLIHFQHNETIPFAVLAGYTWICRKYGYSTVGLLRLPDWGASPLGLCLSCLASAVLLTAGLRLTKTEGEGRDGP